MTPLSYPVKMLSPVSNEPVYLWRTEEHKTESFLSSCWWSSTQCKPMFHVSFHSSLSQTLQKWREASRTFVWLSDRKESVCSVAVRVEQPPSLLLCRTSWQRHRAAECCLQGLSASPRRLMSDPFELVFSKLPLLRLLLKLLHHFFHSGFVTFKGRSNQNDKHGRRCNRFFLSVFCL